MWFAAHHPMTRDQLNSLIRKLLLGVAAAPLLAGCGRSDRYDVPPADSGLPVIPSLDSGFDAGQFDAGGFDAGPLLDGGTPWRLVTTCFAPIDGGISVDDCMKLCEPRVQPSELLGCTPFGDELYCVLKFCGVGRQADGVAAIGHGSGLGAVLGEMAAHEAAAVLAFEQLAQELKLHGLPDALVEGARLAADDERRHSRLVGGLAALHGGSFETRRQRDLSVRPLEEIAFDNAVEGCVRETFGCAVGAWQAEHAADPLVRQVMASVTADEIGHGAWSWSLATALERTLTLAQRRRARELRQHALETVSHGLLSAVPSQHHLRLGLPDQERLEDLARAMAGRLLS